MNAFTAARPDALRATTVCAHCGAPCPDGARFCCTGCAGAHALIMGLGLDRFYARLEGRAPKPAPDAPRHDLAARARAEGDACTLDLMVGGITCAACCWLIEQVLAREPDVTWARVALSTRRLTIRWRGAAARANDFGARIAALGFAVAPFDPSCLAAGDEAEAKRLLRAMGIAAFASMNVMLISVAVWVGHATGDMGPATRDLMHWLAALIALPAVAVAGMPFFRPAFAAFRAGRASLDLPISLGVLATSAMSLSETIRGGDYAYFDSAIMLVFLLLVGRYLDRRARGRAREAAERLMTLNRAPVGVLDDAGVAHPRAPEEVRPGERVLVAPGERIGVDGVVVSGLTTLDESLLTGETLPRAAAPGDTVHAGTLNRDAALVVEAHTSGAGTLLAAIVRLMERAEQSRSRFVALADRVSRWYTPVVHVLAAGTFLLWWGVFEVVWQQALVYAVAVLIITCPCALGIAVPAVQVAAAGGLMRRGVLITSGTAFERLAQADVAVLDKTGTLTRGRPVLQPGAWTEADLRAAAGLAAASRHPLARALAMAAPDVPAAPDVVEHPGEGLSHGTVRLGSARFVGAAPGDGMELFLARPGAPVVRFAFADAPRPDARDAVAALAAQGLVPELLSGDRAPAVAEAARDAGIARWTASADPAAKIARLAALKRDGHRPLMVGDGLNDAPALAEAHVSIAYASGADVTQAAADVVVQTDRLAAVPDTLAVARRAQHLVRQNVAISLGYNVVAVPLAIAGFVTPLIAAVAMAASSLTVILNALRVERRPAWTR
jgi:Cu2+-exporting ATPase